ncbi:MAG TPA: hypothetical protein VMD98_05375 [Bryocella sp.]|nr:hypothetical protein [Bryocella sp.]
MIVLLFGLMAMATPLFAQSETITIKRHARGGKNPPDSLAFLYGDLDGQPVVLQCVLSHADCKELPRGDYSLERLLQGEGSYRNCSNVDVYRLGSGSAQEEPLGEYCLLHEQ